MSVSYDVTSTLREQTKHHEPIVLVHESHNAEEPRSYCVTSHGSYAEGIGTLRASGGDIGGTVKCL